VLEASEVVVRKWTRTGELVPCAGPTINGSKDYRYSTHMVLAFKHRLEELRAARGKLAPRTLWSLNESAEFLKRDPAELERLAQRGFFQMIDGGFKPGDVRRLLALPDLTGLVTAAEGGVLGLL